MYHEEIFDATFFEYLNLHLGVRDYCSEFFTPVESGVTTNYFQNELLINST